MQSEEAGSDGVSPRSPKRAKADSSQKMGSLLLQGWTMRAESCPDCLVPLMSRGNLRNWLCVNCSTSFREAGGGTPVPLDSATPLPLPGTPDKGMPSGKAAAAEAKTFGSEASDALTPEEEAAFSHAEELRAALRRGRGLAGASKRDCSEELAQRVLQGWTLTNDHCPRCQTPLVLSKERELFCVDCQLPVRVLPSTTPAREAARRPAAAAAAPPQAAGQGLASAGTAPAEGKVGFDQEEGPPPGMGLPADVPSRGPPPSFFPREATGGAADAAEAEGLGTAPQGEGTGVRAEVNAASACVLRKMAQARSALDVMTADGALCSRYLLVLRDCAEALGALRRV